MQSVLVYGRLFSRAVANGIYSTVNTGAATTSSSTSSSQSSSSSSPAPPPSSSSSSPSPVPTQGPSAEGEAVNASSRKKLRFLTAVSGFPKNLRTLETVKPGKFGDDAYFVVKHAKGDVIGVADGVGGWRAWGIDPGEFSNSLMRVSERLVRTGSYTASDPAAIIARAYYELLENKTHILGSSTACVVVLQGEAGQLYSANIGDSGFLVVRDGSVVHRSQEQQHYFNTPFQLSLPPPGTNAQVLSDRPESAETREFSVKEGDVLMVATDGVFDNLPDSTIVKEMVKVQGSTDLLLLQQAANSIAQQARKLAFDEDYMSPFARNARENGINAIGGKPDDITVVLATITL
ncbi:protein phosphatase PTC7 homolog [Penaeus vannamei]|uniref:protein phosphatase PTC7 homolog n=1 Tax=Penaeus vannamei TaxID=6689 RepID=UPI00387F6653